MYCPKRNSVVLEVVSRGRKVFHQKTKEPDSILSGCRFPKREGGGLGGERVGTPGGEDPFQNWRGYQDECQSPASIVPKQILVDANR